MNKVKELGQVFTPKNIVDQMYGLTINKGRLLEPSCGHGAFFDYKSSFKDKVAIELDSDICPKSDKVSSPKQLTENKLLIMNNVLNTTFLEGNR